MIKVSGKTSRKRKKIQKFCLIAKMIFLAASIVCMYLYSLASDERCEMPRLISCLPMFVCCACCCCCFSWLFCEINSFLMPLDDDDDDVCCCCWCWCSSCDACVKFCCCLVLLPLLLVLLFLFSVDDFDLQFRRNFVRKFRSGG